MKRLLALLLFSLGLLALPRLNRPAIEPGERRSDYVIEGIDVSRYQAQVEWPEVKSADFDFVFMKATEGQELVDTYFDRNWTGAAASDLKRGAYHFFRPEVSALLQARHFFSHVQLAAGDLPPVLDVELKGDLSGEELVTTVRNWLELAEAHYGLKPILYTGQKFYNRYLAGRFDDYPLWLARYGPREPVPACGRDFQFWQYAERGRVPGIVGNVDLNVFVGDSAALHRLGYQPEPTELRPDLLLAKEK